MNLCLILRANYELISNCRVSHCENKVFHTTLHCKVTPMRSRRSIGLQSSHAQHDSENSAKSNTDAIAIAICCRYRTTFKRITISL